MQLSLIGLAPKEKNSHFIVKSPTEGTNFHIKPTENDEFRTLLNKEGYWLIFGESNVLEIYEKIKPHIPEFTGEVENLPYGHSSGLLDCPGGFYILINDPFGNLLIFNEW